MRLTFSLLCAALTISSTTAAAQSWSADQQAVWKVEEQQWKMSAEKDLTWIPKLVHANMSGWSNDFPAPQSAASLTKWSKFSAGQGSTLEYEIFPIAVTVTGNVAVAQYTYREVTENFKKEHKAENGRWTDVLIRDGNSWKFITWAGGADPEK